MPDGNGDEADAAPDEAGDPPGEKNAEADASEPATPSGSGEDGDLGVSRTDEEMRRKRQLNVSIPVYQHVQLHTLKVLTGKNMSQTVFEALEAYFEDLDEFDASAIPPGSHGKPGEE